MLALDDIALHTASDQIQIAVRRDNGALTLRVDDTPSTAPNLAATTLIEIDPHSESRFAKRLELATPGGRFAAARPAAGRIVLRAAWNGLPGAQYNRAASSPLTWLRKIGVRAPRTDWLGAGRRAHYTG